MEQPKTSETPVTSTERQVSISKTASSEPLQVPTTTPGKTLRGCLLIKIYTDRSIEVEGQDAHFIPAGLVEKALAKIYRVIGESKARYAQEMRRQGNAA